MEIVVTGRHTQIKQRFRDVVESKMNRVTAIAPDAQRVQIVLSHEGNPRQADTAKRVEITVIAGRTVVRAEASSADEFSALDMALDKLTLRLRRTRDRRKDHRRGYSDPVPVDLGVVEPTPEVEEPVEVPNNSPAEAVAAEVGVDDVYAEVLPEDKAAFVQKAKSEGHTVVMIGDGINDSPALSAADVGIAINSGAAIAREIADVTIKADSLEELVVLKTIANSLQRRVSANYRFVLTFNSALIALGAMGILQPASSAMLHNLSTIGISLKSMTNLIPEETAQKALAEKN